jgi:hypothetical protein
MTAIQWIVRRVIVENVQKYPHIDRHSHGVMEAKTIVTELGTVTATDKHDALAIAIRQWGTEGGTLHVQSAISDRISREERECEARERIPASSRKGRLHRQG